MRQPYENIFLGNFILTLGYLAGKRGDELNQTALQLLQQTPDDHTVGDLFANLKGRNFIFEFKRNEQLVRTEYKKTQRAKLLIDLKDPRFRRMAELSSVCHFMSFPVRAANTTLSFMPYLAILDSSAQYSRSRIDLSIFCDSLLGGVPSLGVPFGPFCEYLDFLNSFPDDGPPDGGAGAGGMGALMNISETGEITVVEIENFRALARTLDQEPEPPTPTNIRTMSYGY